MKCGHLFASLTWRMKLFCELAAWFSLLSFDSLCERWMVDAFQHFAVCLDGLWLLFKSGQNTQAFGSESGETGCEIWINSQ